MNPVGERFVGSLRREVLDHVLLVGEQKLEDVARQYMFYFNRARPHQGIGQRIGTPPRTTTTTARSSAFRCSAAFIATTEGPRDPLQFQRTDEEARTGYRVTHLVRA
jgi:transposase InsO family protein